MSKKVESYRDFCSKLSELDHGKRAIENASTNEFLEAMNNWLLDTNGGTPFFESRKEDSISWADLWVLIQASIIYE